MFEESQVTFTARYGEEEEYEVELEMMNPHGENPSATVTIRYDSSIKLQLDGNERENYSDIRNTYRALGEAIAIIDGKGGRSG